VERKNGQSVERQKWTMPYVASTTRGTNGATIAFKSDRSGKWGIYVMNAARLASTTPRWSRDGKKILFYSNASGSDQLYVMHTHSQPHDEQADCATQKSIQWSAKTSCSRRNAQGSVQMARIFLSCVQQLKCLCEGDRQSCQPGSRVGQQSTVLIE
jgi:Tol biopolymer transport system component